MNGFEKHGLKHSSPSALNMFAEAPCAWVARYLFDKRLSFGVAAQIGVLVEKAVVDILCGAEFFNTVEQAKKEFNKTNALNGSEHDRARVDDIEPMVTNALKYLTPLGEPEFRHGIKGREQQSISLLCKGIGWELPVIGFLDLVYPKEGLVVDLKTTMRIPSSMSAPHARQAAIYLRGKGNMAVKFLYVSPKKYAAHEVEDVAGILNDVKAILTRQEKFLRLDKETIKDIVPVNAGSFYWSHDAGIRKELYGV
jgi:hypothetical protein